MPRRAAKIDDNQKEIVSFLRKSGCSVLVTSSSRDGFPDIAVGRNGITVLVEIKDGSKPPSSRKLTDDQEKIHNSFTGAITVIESIEQAMALVKELIRVGSLVKNNWYFGAVANAGRSKQRGIPPQHNRIGIL